MYKEDLALNNLQWLICHKTQPNPTQPNLTQANQSISGDLGNVKETFIVITSRSTLSWNSSTCLSTT